MIREDWPQDDGSGHVLFHVEEHVDTSDSTQYAPFWKAADKNFALRAEGHDELRAESLYAWWVQGDVREFYLRIPPEHFARMEKGVEYELAALNDASDVLWVVAEGVSLTRN